MYRQFTLPYLSNSHHYFERVRHLSAPVYLDSGKPASKYGRYDIISAAPVARLVFDQQGTCLISSKGREQLAGNPFTHLRALFASHQDRCGEPEQESIRGLPFCGGLIGYFSYDLGRTLETLPEQTRNEIDLPDMQAAIYPWAIVTDHKSEQCTLITTPLVNADQAESLLNLLLQKTAPAPELSPASGSRPFRLQAKFTSNVSKASYYQSLDRIHDYIQAGDCYQVNFAQRFNAPCQGDPWQAYKVLREHAPTPYSAYIDTEQGAILSLSPEQFLEVNDGKVTTKPIKGTRPRGESPATDQQLRQELIESEKDRAENLMIVDLLRNDISKVCKHGSVKVPKLFAVESYANVHHLVSTVTGELNTNKSAIDLLEHSFPGGSITGAPKIRAMQIIEELEPHRRTIYCGSIGYLSFNGKLDSSITIRTLLCHNDNMYCWAGGGIVADSETADEYQETYNKVNNLLHALETELLI
ncbi:MAG: aminodeoxychorismate synthase component I [Amphritea sp.]